MSIKLNRWSELFISGFLLILACHFALNFAADGVYFLSIDKYINLHERLPYQYRILMAPVFKILMLFFRAVSSQDFFTHMPHYLLTPATLAYFTVNSIAFFVAVATFRQITLAVFNSTGLAACALFLFVIIAYATFVLNPVHPFILPYDLPSLAFIQLGTLCIIREKWKLLTGLFAVATVNRETTFLLVFFLVFEWWFLQRKERNSALIMAAVLSVIWVAIKLTLLLTIDGDGTSHLYLGGILGWRIAENFAEFLKPWLWPPLLLNLIPFGILAVFLTGRLRSDREWHLTAIVGYAALFPVGMVTEFRAFADLSGFFAMSLTLILREYKVIAPGEIG
jgi:hypothetical protein